MDERLLAYYNSELRYVREMAGEFAREFPKIAGRLALDRDGPCCSPFSTRFFFPAGACARRRGCRNRSPLKPISAAAGRDSRRPI